MILFASACLILGIIGLPDWSPGPGKHRGRPPVKLAPLALAVFGASTLITITTLTHWLD